VGKERVKIDGKLFEEKCLQKNNGGFEDPL
jgi:hypothetical protein